MSSELLDGLGAGKALSGAITAVKTRSTRPRNRAAAPAYTPKDTLLLSEGIREQLVDAIKDMNTAVENYTISYQNIHGIVDLTTDLKEDVDKLDTYLFEIFSEKRFSTVFGTFDTDCEDFKKVVDEHYDELSALCTLYLGVSQTLTALLDATDNIVNQGAGTDIKDLLEKGKLDELFNKNAEDLALNIDEMLGDAAKDTVKSIAKDGGKVLFGAVFSAIFGDTIGLAAGNVAGESINNYQQLTGEQGGTKFSISVVKSLFKKEIKSFVTDSLKNKAASGDGFYASLFEDVEKSKMGLSGKMMVSGITGFAVTFAANVATAWLTDKKITGEDLLDAGVTAGIGTLSSMVVDAVVTAVGLGSAEGPAGVVIGAGSAAISAILTYGGTKLYEWIKYQCKHYGDGVPKSYEHMTNEEILKILDENGYSFDMPKCGERSAFDVAMELSNDGASEELITFVEAGGGANVPLDDFFKDGKMNATGKAILDFYQAPGPLDNWTDDSIKGYITPEEFYDGYAAEYNQQMRQMMDIYSYENRTGNLKAYADFALTDLTNAYTGTSEIMDNIYTIAEQQGLYYERHSHGSSASF